MSECIGWIVRSTAGHDKGALFCVVGEQDQFLLLANGKQRKLADPKRKKRGHVDIMSQSEYSDSVIQKLRCGVPVFDSQLVRTLAAFKGGNQAWQKTI